MDKIHALYLQMLYHWTIPEDITNSRLENIDCLFRCDQDKIYKEWVKRPLRKVKKAPNAVKDKQVFP